MTAWIEMIGDDDASAELQTMFDRVRAPSGNLDNVMRIHSLRPQTMLGHYTLYRSVLHHPDNRLPDWYLETLAAYVSILNGCDYSLTNHFANARHLIGDARRADAVLAALRADRPERAFAGRELAGLGYARKLTLAPADMAEQDVDALRHAGFADGEILEINQVCAYFAYANRLLNGLGVTLAGDVIGYYVAPDPAAEPDGDREEGEQGP